LLRLITPGMDEERRKKSGVFWRGPRDTRGELRVGQVFVPTTLAGGGSRPGLLQNRDRMFAVGVYPGIEYRLMGMRDIDTKETLFRVPEGAGEVEMSVRPIYPLDKRLERPWPVVVSSSDVPCFLTQAMYNSLTLVGTALWSVSVVLFVLFAREAVSFYKIPSASMEPTIHRGDLILAEKLSPLWKTPQRGEILLFTPPDSLKAVVESQGGFVGPRDLFIKRVAALPGDVVTVDTADGSVTVNGERVQRQGPTCDEPSGGAQGLVRPQKGKVKSGVSFVLGDCGPVSVDSRVWGTLSDDDVKARPLVKLWPPPVQNFE